MANEPLEPVPNPEEEEGGPVKTFLEHLEDLRWVLIKCVSSLILGMVTCLVACPYLVRFLTWPLEQSGQGKKITTLGPLGGFTISMKIALYGGITVSLPFILYFIADFVLPALKRQEKVYFKRAFLIGGGLFVAGMALCYFLMLRISLAGLDQYNRWVGLEGDLWRAEEYFHFVIMFMVGMGLSFEVPVLILTLVRLGIIPHEWMVKGRSYFFVANLTLCAFITPDAVSTIFMVVPVQVLMEVCIFISKRWEKQKRLAAAAEIEREKQLRAEERQIAAESAQQDQEPETTEKR